MEFPAELEMLGLLPVVSNHVEEEDSIYWYDFRDEAQTLLRLSFSPLSRSVQTDVFLADRRIVSVCQEGAVCLRVRPDTNGNNMIIGEFGITVHSHADDEKQTARAVDDPLFSAH